MNDTQDKRKGIVESHERLQNATKSFLRERSSAAFRRLREAGVEYAREVARAQAEKRQRHKRDTSPKLGGSSPQPIYSQVH